MGSEERVYFGEIIAPKHQLFDIKVKSIHEHERLEIYFGMIARKPNFKPSVPLLMTTRSKPHPMPRHRGYADCRIADHMAILDSP